MKLKPFLHDGVYIFADVPDGAIPTDAVAMFREREGATIVLPEDAATRLGLRPLFRAAWVELSQDTGLGDLGITAAFSRVLADAGISCNVFAANHHDHIFVPFDRGADAVKLLEKIDI